MRTLHSETSNRSKELPSFHSDYIVSMWLGCPSTKSGLPGRLSNTDCSEFWNSPRLPPPRPTQHPLPPDHPQALFPPEIRCTVSYPLADPSAATLQHKPPSNCCSASLSRT